MPVSKRNSLKTNSPPSSNSRSDKDSDNTAGNAPENVQDISPEDSPTGSKSPDFVVPSPLATRTPTSSRTSEHDLITNADDLISSKQRRLEYFRSGTASDCEVHVPKAADDGVNVCYKKFRCHRVFLASASEKLEQDIIENKHWNGVLQMNGVSPESVEVFLEYIYTFEVTLSKVDLNLIGDIYILSSAYNMSDLLSQFSEQLKNTEWPIEGIFPAYNLAFRHNIFDLENVCMEKIMENAAQLKSLPSILELQIYALNYLIQHWLVIEALSTNEIIQILQLYQRKNSLNFENTQQFPHFTKIIKYFPNVLLDAEGLIIKY